MSQRPKKPPVGSSVRIICGATSANLGPGYDALGLALALRNEVEAEVVERGVEVVVTGEGARVLEPDGSNLVARAAGAAFARLGLPQPGLRLRCHNVVPTGRGLGSSAAAIVAGVSAAYALARPDEALDRQWIIQVAADIEGHPDNVAACALGGATIAWYDDAPPERPGQTPRARAVRLEPHDHLTVTALLPEAGASTKIARALLPTQVPHADAAFTAGRAALLAAALTTHPALLLAATEDRLHQPYRASSMPTTSELVGRLRRAGLAAVVSGAGPAVLVLGTGPALPEALPQGWRRLELEIDREGVRAER